MKFLAYLVPAVAVIVPALALGSCSEPCTTAAVAATQCGEGALDCVCDSGMFLESLFECTMDCGEDDDAALDAAEAFCGALYKRSEESGIEARADGAHRLLLRELMTAIHKIRGSLKRTSGRSERMALFRKLRRARGKLNRAWNDGRKHKGWGRPMPHPPKPAHPGKPTTTKPDPGPTQTVLPW